MADHGGLGDHLHFEDEIASQFENDASMTSGSDDCFSLESLPSVHDLEEGTEGTSGGPSWNKSSSSAAVEDPPSTTGAGLEGGQSVGESGAEEKAKVQRAYSPYYVFNEASYALMVATKANGVPPDVSQILQSDPSFEPGSRFGRKSNHAHAKLARWIDLSQKFQLATHVGGQTRLFLGQKVLLYKEEWNAIIELCHGNSDAAKDSQEKDHVDGPRTKASCLSARKVFDKLSKTYVTGSKNHSFTLDYVKQVVERCPRCTLSKASAGGFVSSSSHPSGDLGDDCMRVGGRRVGNAQRRYSKWEKEVFVPLAKEKEFLDKLMIDHQVLLRVKRTWSSYLRVGGRGCEQKTELSQGREGEGEGEGFCDEDAQDAPQIPCKIGRGQKRVQFSVRTLVCHRGGTEYMPKL